MKMTLITNSKGELVGSIQGNTECRTLVSERGEQTPVSIGVVPGPDQKFTEFEVPDDVLNCEARELHERLKPFLAKAR